MAGEKSQNLLGCLLRYRLQSERADPRENYHCDRDQQKPEINPLGCESEYSVIAERKEAMYEVVKYDSESAQKWVEVVMILKKLFPRENLKKVVSEKDSCCSESRKESN